MYLTQNQKAVGVVVVVLLTVAVFVGAVFTKREVPLIVDSRKWETETEVYHYEIRVRVQTVCNGTGNNRTCHSEPHTYREKEVDCRTYNQGVDLPIEYPVRGCSNDYTSHYVSYHVFGHKEDSDDTFKSPVSEKEYRYTATHRRMVGVYVYGILVDVKVPKEE